MIISCNNCGIKFKVSDDAIGPEGRSVMCSACSHEWFHEGIPNTEEPSVIKCQTRETPSIHHSYQNTWMLYALKGTSALALLFLMFILTITYRTQIISFFPEATPLFEAMYLHDISNLKFDLVDCKINKDLEENHGLSKVDINVKVAAKNTGSIDQFLNAVRFSIYTKDKKLIGEYTMHLNKVIEAGKEEVIEGKINRIPTEVSFIIIEMGNAFDMALTNQSDLLNYKDSYATTVSE